MNAGSVVIIMWVRMKWRELMWTFWRRIQVCGKIWRIQVICRKIRFEDESRYGVGRYEAEMGVQRKSKHRVDVRPSWWKAPRQIIIIINIHCQDHLRSIQGTWTMTQPISPKICSNAGHATQIYGSLLGNYWFCLNKMAIFIARGRLVSQKPVQTQYTFPCQDYWKPFGGWRHSCNRKPGWRHGQIVATVFVSCPITPLSAGFQLVGLDWSTNPSNV